MQDKTASSEEEIAKFAALANDWWDIDGKFRPLHKLNPVRLSYIRTMCEQHFSLTSELREPLSRRALLDIGCGGGLLCEPMARLGAQVTGIDIAAPNIEAAKAHAAKQNLAIDYKCQTAEALLSENKKENKKYDIILAMEVLEHVADPPAFLAACEKLLTDDGILFVATLNRTLKSFAFAIVGAEYVLRWLPRGTHDWNAFITPHEMEAWLTRAGLSLTHSIGVSFNPLLNRWQTSGDLSVNYMGCAKKNRRDH